MPMVGALYEYAASKGYLNQKKLHPVETGDCPDFFPGGNTIEGQINSVLEEMEKIRIEIMGEEDSDEYKSVNEWRKKYRQYKRAVKDLEKELKELQKELREQ